MGKTTLAKIIAEATQASFIEFSAVMGGIKEIKQVMVDAEKAAGFGSRTILFVDEIHRFNKAQQDAFLPYVERGTIRLIGATTENPSFEIIAALLSRCRVYRLTPLTDDATGAVTEARAGEDKERGLGSLAVAADEDALEMMAGYANGDARYAYNALESSARLAADNKTAITREVVHHALQQRVLLYDKQGEEHFNLISALAQEHPQQRCRRGSLLVGTHAAGGRRSHVCGPQARAHGGGRHWSRRSRGIEPDALGARCDRLPWFSGRRSGPRPGGRLPRAGAEVECVVHRLWRGHLGDRSPPCGAGPLASCATRRLR